MERVSILLATPGGQPVAIKTAHERAGTVSHRPRDYSLAELGTWIAKTCVWLVRNRRVYDLIHVLGGYYWAVPFVMVGQLLGKPTIVKIASGEIDLAVRDTFIRRLRTRLLRGTTALIALTEHTRQSALAVGFDEGQVRQIPNGVDVGRYMTAGQRREQLRTELGISEDCFVVLSVGQVGRRKGIDRLLAAWREFHRTTSGPVRLILVGAPDGSISSDEFTRTEDVQLVGHVNKPDQYYGAADSFVLLSRSEGMANVLLEATAAGLPIVVSDIPPNRELASRLGGLVASGTDEQMILEAAEHLRMLERNFRERSPASRNEDGQHVVQREYSLAAVAERYETLYRQLLT